MAFKLFHITEFAESTYLSPETQRQASHPFTLILIAGFWLAGICNFLLWREFFRLPDLSPWQTLWLGLCLLLMMVAALSAILSLLNWRGVLKTAIVLLLLLAAFNVHLQAGRGPFIDATTLGQPLFDTLAALRTGWSWQALLTVVALAIVPAIWFVKTPVRRIPVLGTLAQNLLLCLVSCLVLAGLWLASAKELQPLMKNQPQLQQLLNPFNSLWSLSQPLLTGKLADSPPDSDLGKRE